MKNILILSLAFLFSNAANIVLAQCNCARPDGGFMSGTAFQHIDYGDFRLHYTLVDEHPQEVTQTYIDNIVTYLNEAKNQYATMGYTLPLLDGALGGGNNKYDVYVFNFSEFSSCGSSPGQTCSDPILPGNNNAASTFMFINKNLPSGITVNPPGFALDAPPSNLLRSTVVHEFFHMVQNAYRSSQASGGTKSKFLREGTATWAESLFDITYEYPEGSGTNITTKDKGFYTYSEILQSTYKGFLMDEVVNSPGPYSNVFFWKYLSERFGNDIIKTIWTNYKNNAGNEELSYNQAVSPLTFKEVKEDFWLTHLLMTENLNSYNFLKNNTNYRKYTYANNNSIDAYTPNGNAEVLNALTGGNLVLHEIPVLDVPNLGEMSYPFYCGLGTYGSDIETRMHRMGASYFEINANTNKCFDLTVVPKIAPAIGSTCSANFESNYLPSSTHPEYFEAILVFRNYCGDPNNEENLGTISVTRKMYLSSTGNIKFSGLYKGYYDKITLIIYRHIPVYGNGQDPKIEEFEVKLKKIICQNIEQNDPCIRGKTIASTQSEEPKIAGYMVYNIQGIKIFESLKVADSPDEIVQKLSDLGKGLYIITYVGENNEVIQSSKYVNIR